MSENSTTGTTLANNDVHDDDMSNIYDSPKVPPIPVVMNSAVVSVSELQKNRQIAAAELPTNQPHHDNNNCNTKSLYISHAFHTSDKRPLHSHCYQVNDCQVTYIKNILLLKGGQYFYTEKKIHSSFCKQKYFTYKRWTVFLY